MSDYQLKENSGSLFRNNKKTDEKHPDYKGDIDVDGVKKDIAGWIKKDKNGNQFLSLKISDKYVKPDAAPAPQNESDDTLPF